MADKIRTALDKEVDVSYKDQTLESILDGLADKMGVPLVYRLDEHVKKMKVTIRLSKPVAFGAALQAVGDATELAFYVRDYGILVQSSNLNGPSGAFSVPEFWKRAAEGKKAKEPAGGTKK